MALKMDPMTDSAVPDVLAAYDAAIRGGKSPAKCYQAGVEAWMRAHPDQAHADAAWQAVHVILKARVWTPEARHRNELP
jgi:hypothetical protein